MLLNPIPVPEPKKVRKVIDGIEVKPPRNKSEELPKAITGRFASRSAQIRHETNGENQETRGTQAFD